MWIWFDVLETDIHVIHVQLQYTDDIKDMVLIRGQENKCFYLMWVPECFSQHLLNIPHDGHLLMSSQRVFYPLRCGGTLNNGSNRWVAIKKIQTWQERQDKSESKQSFSDQICILCTRSLQWWSLHHLAVIQCDATWRKEEKNAYKCIEFNIFQLAVKKPILF